MKNEVLVLFLLILSIVNVSSFLKNKNPFALIGILVFTVSAIMVGI